MEISVSPRKKLFGEMPSRNIFNFPDFGMRGWDVQISAGITESQSQIGLS